MNEGTPYGPPGAVGPVLKHETYEVASMSLSRKRWVRLKDEAHEARMAWSELWLGAAFTLLGAGAAAWITFWSLPGPDTHGTAHVSSHAQEILRLVGSFFLVLGAVCFIAWLSKRDAHNREIDRLCKNMESDQHYPEEGEELPLAS